MPHGARNMDRAFFQQLEVLNERYNLEVGSGSHWEQTGKMLIGIERALMENAPDIAA